MSKPIDSTKLLDLAIQANYITYLCKDKEDKLSDMEFAVLKALEGLSYQVIQYLRATYSISDEEITLYCEHSANTIDQAIQAQLQEQQ